MRKSSVGMTPFPARPSTLVPMRWHLQRADLIAATVLAALAASLGTGLGLAAANVRAKDGPQSGPLRMILRGSNEIPSIQRDRFRFQRGLP
jgi:hypothetical protein